MSLAIGSDLGNETEPVSAWQSERFTEVENSVRSWVGSFYYASGIPNGLRTQIGMFRGALSQVKMTEEENLVYDAWSQLTSEDVISRAERLEPPGEAEIEELRGKQDPAVRIMDMVRDFQLLDHPHFDADRVMMSDAASTFDTILASIYGHVSTGTQAVGSLAVGQAEA